MTVVRYYRMTAADGQAEQLEAALRALARTLRPIAGFAGAQLLRDRGEPGSFVFLERWESVEAHQTAAAALPKDAFAPVMAALAGRPEAATLDDLPLDGPDS